MSTPLDEVQFAEWAQTVAGGSDSVWQARDRLYRTCARMHLRDCPDCQARYKLGESPIGDPVMHPAPLGGLFGASPLGSVLKDVLDIAGKYGQSGAENAKEAFWPGWSKAPTKKKENKPPSEPNLQNISPLGPIEKKTIKLAPLTDIFPTLNPMSLSPFSAFPSLGIPQSIFDGLPDGSYTISYDPGEDKGNYSANYIVYVWGTEAEDWL